MAGITGSSSYNDAAGVFFMLAAFYLLLLADPRYLLPAGVLAGFCYAIKLPGVFVVAGAVLFVAAQRRWKPVLIVAAGAALMMAPWMVRAAVLTGNPVAPLMNRLFPNPLLPHRHRAGTGRGPAFSRRRAARWKCPGNWRSAIISPAPTDRCCSRCPSACSPCAAADGFRGRLLWAAALLLALPWLTNTGARFLMPAVVLAAIALGMALPRPAAWAAIALQAVLCWPHVLDAWETRYSFRLHEFPLAAAARRRVGSGLLQAPLRGVQRRAHDPTRHAAGLAHPGAALRGQRLPRSRSRGDLAIRRGRSAAGHASPGLAVLHHARTFDWKATWPEQVVRALRFRMPAGYEGEWDISEVQLFSGEDRLFNSPQWTIGGWPNRWEGPLAFDGNLATRWRTWETVRAGMYFDLRTRQSAAAHLGRSGDPHPGSHVPLEVYGLDVKGRWHLLSNTPQAIPRPPQDIRLEAARAVRRAGFRYLLVPTGKDGNAPIGNVIFDREAEWGMESVGDAGRFHLLHIK